MMTDTAGDRALSKLREGWLWPQYRYRNYQPAQETPLLLRVILSRSILRGGK